jgi:hypothetical protein
VAGVLVVLGVAAAVGVAATNAERPVTTQPVNENRVPNPIVGVCGGTPWSLAEAASSMPFPMLMPNNPLASQPTLVQVWKCSDSQVALEFQSGVVVYLSVNTLKDPAAEWKAIAAEYPEFSVGEVRGTVASLSDPTKASGAAGGVDLVEGGTRITVSGNGQIPLSDLIAVTESLQPAASASGS